MREDETRKDVDIVKADEQDVDFVKADVDVDIVKADVDSCANYLSYGNLQTCAAIMGAKL